MPTNLSNALRQGMVHGHNKDGRLDLTVHRLLRSNIHRCTGGVSDRSANDLRHVVYAGAEDQRMSVGRSVVCRKGDEAQRM